MKFPGNGLGLTRNKFDKILLNGLNILNRAQTEKTYTLSFNKKVMITFPKESQNFKYMKLPIHDEN